MTTILKPVNDEDVINKGYLDKTLRKIDGHISYFENDYNELKLHYNKKSVEQISFQRAVKTTIQILYDNGFLDFYANREYDIVLEDFLFATRRRVDLSEQLIDDIQ